MKDSLKNFLRERLNLSDEDLEKLDRGERPDDANVLRKGDDALRKAADAFVERMPAVVECRKLIGDIQGTLERILNTPDPAAPTPFGHGVFHVRRDDADRTANGYVLDLLKGIQK
jgi:hypothetical protein